MRYDVLGPLTVTGSTGVVPLPPRSTPLVCWLVAHAGRPLPWVVLAGLLWPGATTDPHARARAAARAVVPLLGEDVEYDDVHIRLRVTRDQVDALRFADLLDGRPTDAESIHAALSLWRGEPYRELDRALAALPVIEELVERHDGAVEDLFGLRLTGPVDYRLVSELRGEVIRRPERPRLWRLLALALYRTGRQIEALDVLTPRQAEDPDAAAMRTAIVRHDPQLDRGEPPRELRRRG